jgi:hypothetical protein
MRLASSLAAIALTTVAFAAGAQTAAAPAAAPTATAQADAQAAARQDGATVKAAFERADANHDGKLSREESAALPAVAEKFVQLDKDKDGFLSAEEFETGVTAQPAGK